MPAGSLSLDPKTDGSLLWWAPPEATANLAAGTYEIVGMLDSVNSSAEGAWKGKVASVPATVRVGREAALTAEQESEKLLLLVSCHRLRKDSKQAATHLEELLRRQPDNLGALGVKADLLANEGRLEEALELSEQAVRAFVKKYPDAQEPPVDLLERHHTLVDKWFRQPLSAAAARQSAPAGAAPRPPVEPPPPVRLRADGGPPLSPLGYQDVLKPLSLGVGEDVILRRFAKSPAGFALDAGRVEELKKAGASDQLLAALPRASDSPGATRSVLQHSPVAKSEKTIIDGWGECVDPAGDCAFHLDNAALTITVPGAYHDLWPAKGKVNAPLVLQDVEGDFTVDVKVARVEKAQEGTVLPGLASSVAFHAGTLVIWQDSKNFVRFDRTDMNNAGRAITSCYLHVFRDRERTVEKAQLVADKPTCLRLQRKDRELLAAYSQDDGQTWRSLPARRVALPAKVRVGVAALNSTSRPCSAKFESLKLTPEKQRMHT